MTTTFGKRNQAEKRQMIVDTGEAPELQNDSRSARAREISGVNSTRKPKHNLIYHVGALLLPQTLRYTDTAASTSKEVMIWSILPGIARIVESTSIRALVLDNSRTCPPKSRVQDRVTDHESIKRQHSEGRMKPQDLNI